MNAHTAGRTEGAALKSLSRYQIRALILLARDAFAMEFPPSGETFDAWRHRQCMLAVERPGLTACRNEDFLPLKAHFLRLAGRVQEAEAAVARAAVEPRTWAFAKLREECLDAADVLPNALAYAAGFVRNKRGCTLDDADDKTVWQAVYLVRRRAEQLRRRAAA